MSKYLTIFTISWQNELTYRLNFLVWRIRNILRLLMTYFLWKGVFVAKSQVFGYSQDQVLTYVFLVLIISTIVLSAPSSDNIGGEIGSGDLSNYLVKPVSYLMYWFTRDLASKLLNLVFATFEVSLLWLLLRPEISFPTDPVVVTAAMISSLLAMVAYYFISVSARLSAFWAPENTWGVSFLVLILIDILAGGIFPLNILPKALSILLQLTPFPYLIYYPIEIFLGKLTGWELIRVLAQSAIYLLLMYMLMKYLWNKGLRVYSAEGR